ncbi:hypothetical protein [cyanobacterium endosymbiont of Epithemia turgida]|uniref:hypothetical protein n=1 Tax=cyanobacterium endosymbiont of Epithemia turgida TaxID=718217 RepID=UPI0004D1953E|nr:hypothetical protein [cyanobacterium endosymbiont of Epithemia turgida]BAP17296.1 hypothetical protein ETSB_0439 [cyanobacterium endosymbiont of Epithemia turgida isolate EtSB Lake Yunoko]
MAIVETLGFDCKDNTYDLLSLLCILETLHRKIRSNLFEPSLPNTRNKLYEVLKTIKEKGG